MLTDVPSGWGVIVGFLASSGSLLAFRQMETSNFYPLRLDPPENLGMHDNGSYLAFAACNRITVRVLENRAEGSEPSLFGILATNRSDLHLLRSKVE